MQFHKDLGNFLYYHEVTYSICQRPAWEASSSSIFQAPAMV